MKKNKRNTQNEVQNGAKAKNADSFYDFLPGCRCCLRGMIETRIHFLNLQRVLITIWEAFHKSGISLLYKRNRK